VTGSNGPVARGWRTIRRIVRACLPDAVVARVRLHRYSREFRTNVDVVLPTSRGARRWLATTPDTYRVVVQDEPAGEERCDRPEPPVWTHASATSSEIAAARRVLRRNPGLGLAVVAEARVPRIRGRRRVEPDVAPCVVALRQDVADELCLGDDRGVGIADAVAGTVADAVAVLERARDAGHRVALVPQPWTGRIPARRRDPITAPTSVVVLALVPLHDVGGGSRGAQLTRELLRRGAHVLYAPLFASAEPVDLGLRTLHDGLEQRRAGDLDPDALAARTHAGTRRIVLVEAPVPALVEAAGALARTGASVVYDLIDDWSDADLGGAWYQPKVERELAALADVLVASTPRLAHHLRQLCDREVVLIPNGVDADLFTPDPPGPWPGDLPRPDGLLLGYHGSMYGGWIDWDQLATTARDHPDAALALIGAPPDPPPPLPPNVHLLGLRAQIDLPDYVARFDVGLVPFRVNPTTHAVSPLKVYEYLACGVPVAAPPLEGLAGLTGVHRDASLSRAVAAAAVAPRPDAAAARATHGWRARLDVLAAATGMVLGPRGPEPPTVLREPVRYHRAGRRP